MLSTVVINNYCSEANDDIFMLFNRALVLSEDMDGLEEYAAFYLNLLSVMITYNVGLAYQLAGLQSKGHEAALTRGFDFYSLAYLDLSENDSLSGCRENTGILSLLYSALVNNIGHFHAHSRRIQEAGICTKELQYCLRSFGLPVTEDSLILSRKDYDIFFLNTCFFWISEIASAPAA